MDCTSLWLQVLASDLFKSHTKSGLGLKIYVTNSDGSSAPYIQTVVDDWVILADKCDKTHQVSNCTDLVLYSESQNNSSCWEEVDVNGREKQEGG